MHCVRARRFVRSANQQGGLEARQHPRIAEALAEGHAVPQGSEGGAFPFPATFHARDCPVLYSKQCVGQRSDQRALPAFVADPLVDVRKDDQHAHGTIFGVAVARAAAKDVPISAAAMAHAHRRRERPVLLQVLAEQREHSVAVVRMHELLPELRRVLSFGKLAVVEAEQKLPARIVVGLVADQIPVDDAVLCSAKQQLQ